MKIAFFLGQFPALSETFILNQITGLIDRGHEVDIIALSPGPDAKHHPEVDEYGLLARTTYLPLMPQRMDHRIMKALALVARKIWVKPAVIFRALNFFRDGRTALSLRLLYPALGLIGEDKRSYDVIQAHFGIRGVQAAFLREAGLLEGKLVTAFHGQETLVTHGRGGAVYERLFKTGDLFQPISEVVKKLILDAGAPEKRITIHHMGIELDKMSFPPRQSGASDEIRLLTVCRLVEKKGIEYVLRAIPELPGDCPAVHYEVVGDGPLLESLKALAGELEIEDKVTFQGPGSADDVKRFLANADTFIGPSVTAEDGDTEGIPVSLMEAMAARLPVVSTYHTGIPELIKDGVSGFLAPERDVKVLVEALDRLIRDADLRHRMGQEGRMMIDQEFNVKRLNNRLEDTYRALIKDEEEGGYSEGSVLNNVETA